MTTLKQYLKFIEQKKRREDNIRRRAAEGRRLQRWRKEKAERQREGDRSSLQ